MMLRRLGAAKQPFNIHTRTPYLSARDCAEPEEYAGIRSEKSCAAPLFHSL